MSQEVVEPKNHEELYRPINHCYDEQRMSVPLRERDIEERSRRVTQ